ncbi:MAG TPA: DUF488 domain-containing protein [Candidatus Udaeobacter sp.]|jgi:uncharacterized protein (DUF488 family)|nr:DUF488 domain-containing protein [Candidatus Udaeobacter sp.]
MISRIWTIGHSTRAIDIFISLLEENGIKVVADVRRLPGSKRYPQFNRETLAKSLKEHGIRYEHFPELGGRRKAKKDSHNTAWRNASFRGYADHMETEEFRTGIERLLDLAQETQPIRSPSSSPSPQREKGSPLPSGEGRGEGNRIALMCAEAVWWRCHRALISDYLKMRGVEVVHIVDAKKTEPHPYTSAARIVNGELKYH